MRWWTGLRHRMLRTSSAAHQGTGIRLRAFCLQLVDGNLQLQLSQAAGCMTREGRPSWGSI